MSGLQELQDDRRWVAEGVGRANRYDGEAGVQREDDRGVGSIDAPMMRNLENADAPQRIGEPHGPLARLGVSGEEDAEATVAQLETDGGVILGTRIRCGGKNSQNDAVAEVDSAPGGPQ